MMAEGRSDSKPSLIVGYALFVVGFVTVLIGALASYGFAHAFAEPRLGFSLNALGMLLCLSGYFSACRTDAERKLRIAARTVLVWLSLSAWELVRFVLLEPNGANRDWMGIPSEREAAFWRGLTGLLGIILLCLFELRLRLAGGKKSQNA